MYCGDENAIQCFKIKILFLNLNTFPNVALVNLIIPLAYTSHDYAREKIFLDVSNKHVMIQKYYKTSQPPILNHSQLSFYIISFEN